MLEKNITFELKMKSGSICNIFGMKRNLKSFQYQFRIINKLSDSLKNELLLEANGPFLEDSEAF